MGIKCNLKVYGDRELYKKLKGNVRPSDIKRVVKHNGVVLVRTMKRKAEFRGHYEWVAAHKSKTGRNMRGKYKRVKPTGTTKRSIHMTIKDAGFAVSVEPTTSYAKYLEYGTRFMSAQPFVRPAFEEVKPKFLHDLQKLVKN